MDSLAAELRQVVLGDLRHAPEGTGVLLSGGVDSQAVLYALLALEKKPVALSFTLDDRESRDFRLARDTAALVEVPFYPVRLPTDLDVLRRYIAWAVGPPLRLSGKAEIECFWPRWVLIQEAFRLGLPALATGDGGDGYFALSKKGMLHYRETAEKMDEFRDWYFGRGNWSQTRSIRTFAHPLPVFMPLAHHALRPLFRGRTWEELNQPRQKMPIREAFPPVAELPPHTNLQLGDSGIAELFEEVGGVRTYNEAAKTAGLEESGQGGLF